MTRRGSADAAQLNNRALRRTIFTYGYLIGLAALTLSANLLFRAEPSRPDDPLKVLFLIAAAIVLSADYVRIDRGRLALTGITIGTASVLLNPLDATLVGMAIAIPMVRRGRWTIAGNALMAATAACWSSVLAQGLGGATDLWSRALVISAMNIS